MDSSRHSRRASLEKKQERLQNDLEDLAAERAHHERAGHFQQSQSLDRTHRMREQSLTRDLHTVKEEMRQLAVVEQQLSMLSDLQREIDEQLAQGQRTLDRIKRTAKHLMI